MPRRGDRRGSCRRGRPRARAPARRRTSSRPASTRAWCSRERLAAGEAEVRAAAPPGRPAPRAPRARCRPAAGPPTRRGATRRGARRPAASAPTAAPTISAVSRARASWLVTIATQPAVLHRARRARAPARGRGRSAACRSSPERAGAARCRRSRRGARGGSPRGRPCSSFSVSARSPRRSVSSEITSPGCTLPRLTSVPKCSMNQICWWRCGASKISRSMLDLVDDLVDQAGAHLAVGPVHARPTRPRGPRRRPASRRPRAPRGSARPSGTAPSARAGPSRRPRRRPSGPARASRSAAPSRSDGIGTIPLETSTWSMPSSSSQARRPSTLPCSHASSVSVPPSIVGHAVGRGRCRACGAARAIT